MARQPSRLPSTAKPRTAKVKVSRTKEPREPNFRNEIIPILTRAGCNSGACHGALAGKGGLKLSLRGYDPEADHFALTRQANGRRIDLNSPAKSLMLLKPSLALPHGGGTRFKAGDPAFERLAEWIAFGASGLKPKDPHLERLEVFPSTALLKPEDVLRVIVRAWYSDGRAVDVTHLARFASTEEIVAGVDDFGKVKIKGPGETAINIAFGSEVANLRITVPFAHKVNDKQFDPARFEFNWFQQRDRSTGAEETGVAEHSAVGLCNDHEFIRRAYLDAAGILPTPEEVRKFLADKPADKRAEADRRLAGTAGVRRLLVVQVVRPAAGLDAASCRSRRCGRSTSSVRQSVADNKPWDRFARDIADRHGSTLQQRGRQLLRPAQGRHPT